MLFSHDLSGLIKYAGREPWKSRLDACLAEHLEPAADELGVDLVELLEIVGPQWEGPLWGCAFEDLLGREIDGQNLADDYLKRRGWNETAPVRTYVKALRETPMSLYEVSDIVPGQSMRLRDLLQDLEPVTVEERSASRTLRNWDRIATRLVRGNSRHVISGALLAFGPKASGQLISGLASISSRPDPGLDFDVTDRAALLRYSAPLFTATWLMEAAGAMQSVMPDLVNSDGDDILFHRLVFPLARGVTQKHLAGLLDTHGALSQESAKAWTWLEVKAAHPRKGGKARTKPLASAMDAGSAILGDLELSGRFLTIEVNSAQRAERAQQEFILLLGALVQPPLTEIRTVEQMMAELDDQHDPDDFGLDISSAEMQRIAHEMTDRHYREVCDKPVPALGGKSPRQMARTKAGRVKLAEWLKYIENNTASSGNGQMAGYSFAWIWDELGVADLRK